MPSLTINHFAFGMARTSRTGALSGARASKKVGWPRIRLYSNHPPLAIMWPTGIKNPGRKITDFVSFIDFAQTFLQVAGVENAIIYNE